MIGMLLNGCSAQGQKTRAVDSTLELRPVIVQGAMDLEVKKFASRLDNVRLSKSAVDILGAAPGRLPGDRFQTMKGASNSAAATAIAAERANNPVALINHNLRRS